MFTFSYTLREQDFIDISVFHTLNSQNTRVIRLLLPVLILAVVLLPALPQLSSNPVAFLVLLCAGCAAAFIVGIVFFNRIIVYFVKTSIEKLKRAGKLPHAQNITLSFKDDTILEATESGETASDYTALARIVAAEKHVIIYRNAVNVSAIPHRAFKDDGEKQDFIRFIQSKIKAD